MTIPNLPLLDPFSPTFRGDVDAFFGGQIQATINAINPEIERINQIGAGAFTATSSTSLTIVAPGTINLTINTGKSFVPGQFVIVARTASPGDYMAGQVVSYNAGTGAMVVNATASSGSGAHSGWTVSVTSIVSALELDSIIVLTSGTSWTVPDGVRKVVGYVEGASGSGGVGNGTIAGAGGGGGGGVKFVADVTPGAVYPIAIAAAPTNGGGGSSSITIDGQVYQADGGDKGSGGGGAPGNGVGGENRIAFRGNAGHSPAPSGSGLPLGGTSAFGGSIGGVGVLSGSPGKGGAGRIVLELYK